MSAIFLSDVHLRDSDSVKSRLVIRFLQQQASCFDEIYILGDLFDVWPGTNAQLIRHYQKVIDTLRGLVREGHRLHYIEGNHDFRLGDFFSQELGIEVSTDSVVKDFGGMRTHLSHGDLGNPKDLGYRLLRRVLRQDALHLAMKAFPQDWIFKVGSKTSNLSRQYQSKLPREEALIRQTYRLTAERIFQKGFDVVIMGHTHLPDDLSTVVDGRSCRYINTGDWLRHFTYLEFDGSQFYTKTHPVKDL